MNKNILNVKAAEIAPLVSHAIINPYTTEFYRYVQLTSSISSFVTVVRDINMMNMMTLRRRRKEDRREEH
jgi:hypothetical protein